MLLVRWHSLVFSSCLFSSVLFVLCREFLLLIVGVIDILSTFYEDRQVTYDRRLVIQSQSSGSYRLESQGAELLETAPREIGQPKLQEYQEEMQAFTRFLEEIYFSEDASTSSS